MKTQDNVILATDDIYGDRIEAQLNRRMAAHTLRPGLAKLLAAAAVDYHATPVNYPQPLEELDSELAAISGGGALRGPHWYNYETGPSSEHESDFAVMSGGSNSLELDSERSVNSSEASSKETRERKRRTRAYRECTPCPLDMVRKHSNYGIKWICGAYQRARRTFKSDCMMRFRNCQDGTMFVKVSEQRCPDDGYHGKHWFYVYRI